MGLPSKLPGCSEGEIDQPIYLRGNKGPWTMGDYQFLLRMLLPKDGRLWQIDSFLPEWYAKVNWPSGFPRGIEHTIKPSPVLPLLPHCRSFLNHLSRRSIIG
ncbi:hypothetical protein LIER_29842 [Lithospermum erythrorhizon]|uniref:Uncharacterized protein n=1 Tax=Lithospermum erythrorhizon TaxID=34254 RepID=A0AAV3RMI4_LITER